MEPANVEMHIINVGQACFITNYGLPRERRNPASAGSITKQPLYGTAEFVAPRATYTPKPGFEGEDYFEYEANALGLNDKPLFFRVRVKVFVKAP
jgi:hypothetical protein